jgi:hypothetical protein
MAARNLLPENCNNPSKIEKRRKGLQGAGSPSSLRQEFGPHQRVAKWLTVLLTPSLVPLAPIESTV